MCTLIYVLDAKRTLQTYTIYSNSTIIFSAPAITYSIQRSTRACRTTVTVRLGTRPHFNEQRGTEIQNSFHRLYLDLYHVPDGDTAQDLHMRITGTSRNMYDWYKTKIVWQVELLHFDHLASKLMHSQLIE